SRSRPQQSTHHVKRPGATNGRKTPHSQNLVCALDYWLRSFETHGTRRWFQCSAGERCERVSGGLRRAKRGWSCGGRLGAAEPGSRLLFVGVGCWGGSW